MNNSNSGFTLVELIVVISILMVLGLSVPSFHTVIANYKRDITLDTIYDLSQYAHALAITEQRVITVCGSKDGIHCIKNWQQAKLVVFADEDNNKKIDQTDTVFKSMSISSARVQWRGSNRNYMRFHPQGYSIEWGRYSVCPLAPKDLTIKQLVFNRMGRAYQQTIELPKKEYQKLCQKT